MTIHTAHYPSYSLIVLLQVISNIYICDNMIFLNCNLCFSLHSHLNLVNLSRCFSRGHFSLPSLHRGRQIWGTYCRNINQAWQQHKWKRFRGLRQRKFAPGRVYRSNQMRGRSGKDGELPGRKETVEKPPAQKLTFAETNSLSSCSLLRITPLCSQQVVHVSFGL